MVRRVLTNSRLRVSRTVSDYDRIVALDGFVGDGFREVDRKEDGVHLTADRIEWRFEEYCPESKYGYARSQVNSIHPVLSKLLSANASGYNLRMALTTALV